MIALLQTIIICMTALAIAVIFCRTFKRHEPIAPPETDIAAFQKKLDEEYQEQREQAMSVIREIQSIFLDDDQIVEGGK